MNVTQELETAIAEANGIARDALNVALARNKVLRAEVAALTFDREAVPALIAEVHRLRELCIRLLGQRDK